MKITIVKTKNEGDLLIARKFCELVEHKPNAIWGLATGETAEGVYDQIVNLYQQKKLNFSYLRTFNLDEYYPIDEKNAQSYHYYMYHRLFKHTNLNLENTYFPDLKVDYDLQIKKMGGIDIQLLSIGTNGHIAYNEPGSPKDSKTRLIDLTFNTIKDNSRFFNNINEVPKQAITMGLATIMKAKKIILVAYWKHKSPIVQKILDAKKYDPNIPATILYEHPNVEFIIDEECYSLIKK